MQAPLQFDVPVAQAHVPLWQLCPVAQTLPQAPQFPESTVRLRQAPLHGVVPVAHEPSPPAEIAPPVVPLVPPVVPALVPPLPVMLPPVSVPGVPPVDAVPFVPPVAVANPPVEIVDEPPCPTVETPPELAPLVFGEPPVEVEPVPPLAQPVGRREMPIKPTTKPATKTLRAIIGETLQAEPRIKIT